MSGRPIRILGISGSLRERSANTLLLRRAAAIAPERAIVRIYEGIGDLPHFNPDLDAEEQPAAVQLWRAALNEADAMLLCTPEYANGVPGSLKNALDWLVSSGELYGKPAAVISASPHPAGGEKAHASLLMTLRMMNSDIAHGSTMIIPYVGMKLNAEGEITDPDTMRELDLLLDALVRAAAAKPCG